MKFIPTGDDIRSVIDGQADVWKVIENICENGPRDDPLYICNVDDIVRKYNIWMTKMPRVQPHYAVKCNDSNIVLTTLAALGTGFDCASKSEIAKVIDLGVDPERIIFANPTKPASHIRYALKENVDTMTFDSDIELQKIKLQYPDAQLVLRIRCDAERSQCPLGKKYGCDPFTEAPKLIKSARRMDLNVVGISFHVGSGCNDYPIYYTAIKICKDLFDYAETIGYNFNLLDIGGGFPGDNDKIHHLNEIAKIINTAIDEYFPIESGVKIISEPGRFFVSSAYTLITCIHSKKEVMDLMTSKRNIMYYINDGVYGSFNCQLYDHAVVTPHLLKSRNTENGGEKKYPSIIWGPTCDALDQITMEIELPNLDVGDFLIFENMGAYTMCCASPFNGFPVPEAQIYVGNETYEIMKALLPSDSALLCLIADSVKQHNKVVFA